MIAVESSTPSPESYAPQRIFVSLPGLTGAFVVSQLVAP
jgi:hypothetical protein